MFEKKKVILKKNQQMIQQHAKLPSIKERINIYVISTVCSWSGIYIYIYDVSIVDNHFAINCFYTCTAYKVILALNVGI